MTGPATIDHEPGLDGLRGVSIVGVLLFHACATSGLEGWWRGGNLGVSVFFTLSGFLITSLLLVEADRTGRVDLARFWVRRIKRLAPASLTVIGAVVVVSATTDLLSARSADVLAALWSATNWHVIASGDARLLQTIVGPLGPTWSLAVEEQLYVGLAILAAVAARRTSRRRVMVIAFTTVVAASVVVANVVSDWHPRLEFGTDVRAGEVAVGGLLAIAVSTRRRQLTAHAVTIDAVGWVALVAIVTLFLTADYSPAWLLRGGFAVVGVLSAAVVAGVLAHRGLARALSARPWVAVGRWSYSLYLVHWPLFLLLTPARTHLDGAALVALKCGTAMGVALALHLGVEQPVRRAAVSDARRVVGGWLVATAVVSLVAVVALG